MIERSLLAAGCWVLTVAILAAGRQLSISGLLRVALGFGLYLTLIAIEAEHGRTVVETTLAAIGGGLIVRGIDGRRRGLDPRIQERSA